MRKRLIALLIAGCSSAAIAGEPGWTVSETSGPVQIGHAGISKVATRGLGVAEGDTVSTGPGGRAVLVRGTEYMMVAGNSRLRLPAEQKASGFTQMAQDFGNVVFMIKKKMTPHFEVKTPYLAAVVKGTTFSVGVTPKGASVQVLEGAVEVATPDGGAHELLRPGAIAVVGAGDLYRMRVETNGVTKVIVSPAAPIVPPIAPISPTATTPAVETLEPAAKAQPAIFAAVYEAPVSLATVTGGLVTGSTGGRVDLPDLAKVADATRTATEASSSAVKAVEVAKVTIAADSAKDQSATVASKAGDDAAKASADSVKADADKASKDSAKDASQAAKDAADKAAKDAAKAAEQAAKDADEAAKKAAKAAEDAAKDDADDAAKDAAKAAKDASDKAAKDAAKAADDATKAAADQAAKAADDAAKAAEKEAAKAAADQAKQAEKAAKDAKKAADDAAKAADDAAKAAKKAADDAAKAAEDAMKGKKGGK